jgi:RNA polymerase sigma-70 factor (ECF subfamily)
LNSFAGLRVVHIREEGIGLPDEIETELLLRAQRGDWEAFESLQGQLEPLIRRYVRRLIGMGDAEDDIVQDTFIALYKNLNRIEPVENLRPYVFRIARNRCYDELRRSRPDDLSLDDEQIINEQGSVWVSYTDFSANGAQPDELTHWLLLNLEVQEAMERLPDAQREVLILFSEHDLSYTEIAAITHTSVGTVKSRLFYARKNLFGLLRPETLDHLKSEFSG